MAALFARDVIFPCARRAAAYATPSIHPCSSLGSRSTILSALTLFLRCFGSLVEVGFARRYILSAGFFGVMSGE